MYLYMNINVIITQQFFQVHQYFLRLKGGPQQYKPPLMGHTLVIDCWGGNLEYRNKQNRLHTWIIFSILLLIKKGVCLFAIFFRGIAVVPELFFS